MVLAGTLPIGQEIIMQVGISSDWQSVNYYPSNSMAFQWSEMIYVDLPEIPMQNYVPNGWPWELGSHSPEIIMTTNPFPKNPTLSRNHMC